MTQDTFSTKTLTKAAEAIQSYDTVITGFQQQLANGVGLSTIAVKFLCEQFEISESSAQDIINDLKKGSDAFEEQFEGIIKEDKLNVTNKLVAITEGKSNEERIKLYANVLTTLELLGQKDLSQEDVENRLATNLQFSIEQLTTAIETNLNDKLTFDSLVQAVQESVDSSKIGMLTKQIEAHKGNYCFFAALLLYTAQRKGEIRLTDSEVPLSAELVGALAGAGIEATIATGQLANGEISLTLWQKIMKAILLTVLFIAAVALMIVSIFTIASSVVLGILSLLGTGIFGTVVGLWATLYITLKLSDIGVEFTFSFLEKVTSIYDKYINPLCESISAWVAMIKNWTVNLWEKVCGKISDTANAIQEKVQEQRTPEQDSQSQTVQQPKAILVNQA